MKRVLLVSNRLMHYRVPVYNYLARRFRDVGWELSVLASELQTENQNPLEFECTVHPFQLKTYRRVISELAPDAVILFLHLKDRITWPLLHWLKFRRIPVAVWTKAKNLDDPDNALRNLAFHYLHRMADALILYNATLAQFVSAEQHAKIFVANNTINFESFPAVSETKAAIKESLGIPFEKVVLFVGRIAESGNRKKVDHLIDMFRDHDMKSAGLVIVGSGLTPDLRSRMNPANTVYLGEVHDPENVAISRIFTMSDVCAIPGHVGLGLNQAFYFGLPMVTEEGRQPPEIEYLADGRNGFIVAENDTNALRERLCRLLEDDTLRRRMGDAARQDILDRAPIEGMFRGFADCVEYLSQRQSRRTVAVRSHSGSVLR